MAERAYIRRRGPEGNPVPETPPTRRETSLGLPSGMVGALEIIDLNTHPDGKLLRLVVQATKLFDGMVLGHARWPRSPTEHACDAIDLAVLCNDIAAIGAVTADGWRAKVTFACTGDGQWMARSQLCAVAYSALRDAMRLGVVP